MLASFEGLLDPLRVLSDLADELLAGTCDIAELLHGSGRHEARANQPVRRQVGDPHRVVDVGLPARQVANVHSVREHEFEGALQHMPNGLPEDARRFHRSVRAPIFAEPVAQREQALGRRVEGTNLLRHLSLSRDAHARNDGVLMNIEPGTFVMDHLHCDLPSVQCRLGVRVDGF